jgi:hypothetical protein
MDRFEYLYYAGPETIAAAVALILNYLSAHCVFGACDTGGISAERGRRLLTP